MKNILLAVVLMLGFQSVNAQYVTIPDVGLRNYFKGKYPACFNGSDMMDTTCNAILNETIFLMPAIPAGERYNIASLEGIQYFKQLQNLQADRCRLTTLPNRLPISLKTINVTNNFITSIAYLPDSLTGILCDFNNLISLPSLPNLLTIIKCNNNQLANLPNLPNGLNDLYCDNNQLTTLPVLPSSLKNLGCGNNQLTVLQNLPSSLTTLTCDTNQLTILPTLPSLINTLYCESNQLSFLPVLPNTIQFLSFGNNQISTLAQLPTALQGLACKNNPLSCLPLLPSSLQVLLIKGTNIHCLPNATNASVDTAISVCTTPCDTTNFVRIPDANFRASLKAKYPSCFNVIDMMDTTCSSVTSLAALNLNNKNIVSMQGIQYFKNLVSLQCDSNQITTIPNLPNSLIVLHCSHNRLSTLSVLPITLSDLDCSYNLLTQLPTILHVSTALNCSNNPSLTCLPTLASSIFQGIKIKNTGISCFPNDFGGDTDTLLPFCNSPCAYIINTFVSIPDSNFRAALKAKYPTCFNGSDMMDTTCSAVLNASTLTVKNKNIESIEGVEYFKTLTYLYCDSNNISSLNKIPNSVLAVNCSFNQLTTLPLLPVHLFYLNCNNNRLTIFSALPSTVAYLDCSHNQLSSFAVNLRDSLGSLYLSDNPLSCLPFLPRNLRLYIKNTNVTCLPNTVTQVDTILPVCTNASDICAVNPFVQGKIYNDANNNNTYEVGEQLIPQQIIKVLPNNWLGASDVNGSYFLKLDTAINNTWSAINNYRYATITPASYSLANIHNLGLQSGSYDFGVHLIADVKDLETTLGSSPARPGFTTNVTVTANNVGTVNQSNITIKLKKPNGFNVSSTSIAPTSTINDTLIWKNISINYLEHQSINIQLQVPVNAVLGDNAIYEAWSNGTLGDSTPIDNYIKWKEIIRGSFDPNDKLVNKKSLLPTYNADKDRLLYTIRFQNTGTDTAFTVIVRDEIPSNLDVSSLRVVNASHQYQLIVREKNIVEVAFPNIQLPAKTQNEAKSHGFVQLEFKPKAGLPVNAEINNNASIFFDYNAPIITNTATTKIQIVTGIANNKKLAFKLFPNPTSQNITVELPYNGIGNWYLTDISGKVIKQNNIENTSNNFTIDVNEVANGTYLLSLEMNGNISSSKVVILR